MTAEVIALAIPAALNVARSLTKYYSTDCLAERTFSVSPNLFFSHPFLCVAKYNSICDRLASRGREFGSLLNRIDLPLEWPAQLKAIGINFRAPFADQDAPLPTPHADQIPPPLRR
jgi:hypothetical protein